MSGPRTARRSGVVTLALALLLGACNSNSAPGNDREAASEPPAAAAPIAGAGEALSAIATALVKPETMTPADIAALGGLSGRCEVAMTEMGFPSFVYEPGGDGAIKLNGTLIRVAASGPHDFADGDLRITLRTIDDTGNMGDQGMEMIVVPPGARDEIGYHGYRRCHPRA